MLEIGDKEIINTIKGIKHGETAYCPVDPTGKPLVSKKSPGVYGETGREKQTPLKGEVVDTEA